jgi:hypothetical protein
MTKSEKIAVIGISTFMILWVISIISYRSFYLMESNYTYAVYIGSEGSAWGTKRFVNFKTPKNINRKAEISYDEQIKIGDTVWIKYSKEKPEIAEVIDKDYKKYMSNKATTKQN